MEHNYFPQEFLDLQEELGKSPPAQDHMMLCDSPYIEDRLAHLCTYLDILVDDDFNIDELSELAGMCARKLFEKRTGIVTTH